MKLPVPLSEIPLFKGISQQEFNTMDACLHAHLNHYDAGNYIEHMGDLIKELGVVVEGSVILEHIDIWGTVSVVNHLEAGSVFGEVFAVLPQEPLNVNVIAAEDSSILFLDARRVMASCSRACPSHQKLAINLNEVLAYKNLSLSQRIMHAAPKTIRGKVLSYLSHQATRAG